MKNRELELQENDPEVTGLNPIIAGGDRYDINNIPGKKKAELILSGESKLDDFVAPANIPGKKLMQLREQHAETVGNQIKELTEGMENSFQVADLVKKRTKKGKPGNKVYEVKEVDPEKGCLIDKEEGGSVWVHHSKLIKVELDESE